MLGDLKKSLGGTEAGVGGVTPSLFPAGGENNVMTYNPQQTNNINISLQGENFNYTDFINQLNASFLQQTKSGARTY